MSKNPCVAGLMLLACAATAQAAETCAQKIARLEKRIHREAPTAAGSLPESVSAKLHRQPTVASVANADRQSDADTLDDARLLDAEGKEKACLDKLKQLGRN
jgi:hypothetical protein